EILAEHWPGDLDINYSSPWAVANPETGLMRVQIRDYMDKKPDSSDIWFKDFVPEV
ncbi:3638_t:CDS:2, partial [Racocetra fulgida]